MTRIMPPFTWAVLVSTGWSYLTPWAWWVDVLVFIIASLIGGFLVGMETPKVRVE